MHTLTAVNAECTGAKSSANTRATLTKCRVWGVVGCLAQFESKRLRRHRRKCLRLWRRKGAEILQGKQSGSMETCPHPRGIETTPPFPLVPLSTSKDTHNDNGNNGVNSDSLQPVVFQTTLENRVKFDRDSSVFTALAP